MSNADRILLHSKSVQECRHVAEVFAHQHNLDAAVTASTGRPRGHSATTLLTLLLLACDENKGNRIYLRDAADVARALTPTQRQTAGLFGSVSQSQIYRFVDDLTHRELRANDHGEVTEKSLPFTMDELATSMVRAAIPPSIPETGEYAIDGTDVESWASRHRASHFCPDGKRNHADCHHQMSFDREARWGYRTAGQNQDKLFLGYTAHLSTDIPLLGEQTPRPSIIRAIALRPVGSHAGHAGMDVITELERHTKVDHVLADRAYSNAGRANWADPLAQHGITQSFDLHPAQVGSAPGPKNLARTEFIDGTLFSAGMPPRLRHLHRSSDAAGRMRAIAAFDERARYAFTPFSEGSKRLRGPAVRGHERVRCVNAPASMVKTHLPLTNCQPGQPCSCAKTVTLNDHPRPELIQHFAWGTSDWEADFGRRSLIESANSFLKLHFGNIKRGAIRVMGQAKVTFAFGIICAVANMRLIRDRYGDLLMLGGEKVDPLPRKGRTPYRGRYRGMANPRAGRGRAPTGIPASMVPPTIGALSE